IGSGLSTDATIAYEGQGGSAFDLQTGPTADASLSWLLDPFGGRESQRAAAAARIEVADAEVDAARLLLLDSLMRAYIDLRFTQASLALRHIERRSRRRSVGLVRELLDANSAIRLDLVRAQALLAETETIIPVLEAAQTARMNEIAVLLGQAPGSTRLPPGREGRQLGAPPVSEIGVPADLVRNRPDIRIAERLYYAATADIGAARAALFPSLSLTGTISFAAFGGVETNTYGFGPSLTLPALPNGPRRAAVEVAESRARQAHTNWTSTVLSAIGGVETALADYQANHRAVAAARRSVRRYEEAVTLTRELLVNQGATVQDLLDAERQVAAARITLARTERDLAQSYANLNVALGSGNQS
ncbi:MAG: efflux transporter outer membrane subunit, partial [Pseudomonadota bacterium]